MKLYSRDRARRSLFDTIGFRALSQIATVLSYPVLVRGLSEHDFGILNLMYSVIPLVLTLGSLGLDNTLRRFQPEFLLRGDRGASAWLVRKVRLARLGSNVLLLALILAGWQWIAPRFGLADYRPDFAIFCLMILLYFQVTILQISMASQMLHRYSVGSVALVSFGKLAGYGALWAAGGLTLRTAILSDLGAHALAYAFLAVQAQRARRAEGVAPAPPDAQDRARMKRFAGYNHLNDSASLLTYTETDRFFIAGLLNPLAVGAYAFYTRLNEMASSLVPQKLFENVVQPMVFAVPREEARERLPRYFTLLLNVNWLYQLPVIVICLVFHREIVGLVFGGKFLEYSYLLPVVVAFAFSDNVISIPVTLVAQYEERASLILVSQVFGVYQIVAMLTLIPWIGLAGAATATGTFHLFRNLFVWWKVRDLARWNNAGPFLLWATLIWGVAALACWAVREYLPLPSWLLFGCGLVVCGLAALVHLRSAAVSASDRQLLAGLLHGRESNVLRWLGLLPRPGVA